VSRSASRHDPHMHAQVPSHHAKRRWAMRTTGRSCQLDGVEIAAYVPLLRDPLQHTHSSTQSGAWQNTPGAQKQAIRGAYTHAAVSCAQPSSPSPVAGSLVRPPGRMMVHAILSCAMSNASDLSFSTSTSLSTAYTCACLWVIVIVSALARMRMCAHGLCTSGGTERAFGTWVEPCSDWYSTENGPFHHFRTSFLNIILAIPCPNMTAAVGSMACSGHGWHSIDMPFGSKFLRCT
jgi:hypothetical protein